MREPHKFPATLTGVMAFLLGTCFCFAFVTHFSFLRVVLFGGAGILAYLTFGSEIQTVVLVNLDSSSKMVQSVRPLGLIMDSLLLMMLARSNSSTH